MRTKRRTRGVKRKKEEEEEEERKEEDKEEEEEEEEKLEKEPKKRRVSRRLLKKHEESEKEKKSIAESEKNFGKWTKLDSVFYFQHSKFPKTFTKIASFDFDSTLVSTKSGKTFAQNQNDWKPWCALKTLQNKLKEYHDKGYALVIFTNQMTVTKKKMTLKSVENRIQSFIKLVDLPINVVASLLRDENRKPFTGMWDFFLSNQNILPNSISLSSCFYVGDAAGRIAKWKPGKKKDFSCGDRKFALNLNIDFYTPEEFFLNEKPVSQSKFSLGFDPNSLKSITYDHGQTKWTKDEQEMIICVGRPACGKSSFTKTHLVKASNNKYVRINRDTLKTQPRCQKEAERCLNEGKSVVIDNTNPSFSARLPYLKIAKRHKIKCRCFVFDTKTEICDHMNNIRPIITNGEVHLIPKVAIAVFKKKFEHPDEEEGFSEIKTIQFQPNFNNDKRLEKIFYSYSH